MSQRIYTIGKAFLIPLGVDVILLCSLFVISLLPQGSATERLVFAIFFVPSLYLFFECFLRRVTVDGEGIAIRKLLREKRVPWEGITSVGSLSVHKK
ncbi:MAG: PH domain-containing protein, partial [Deltaproteobacteria bacterium]